MRTDNQAHKALFTIPEPYIAATKLTGEYADA